MNVVSVKTQPSYQVLLGKNLLCRIDDLVKDIFCGTKIAIITDDNVDKLYSECVESVLRDKYSVCKYVFCHGEGGKSLENYSNLLEFLTQNDLKRTDLIVALGGGVVGDVAGFAAATYLRGIKFVSLPTTLLSMIDSSVGGKTGINLRLGKNLVGAFYQPSLVVADIGTLDTLDEVEFQSGLGELIKYGILAGGELWDLIERKEFLSLRALELCIEYKRDIVEADEKESGVRKLLNLGHTFGHALEKLADYSVPHGKAVATGIAIIAHAQRNKGFLSLAEFDKIMAALKDNQLLLPHGFSNAELISAARNDKKSVADKITLIGVFGIGDCRLVDKQFSELGGYLGG